MSNDTPTVEKPTEGAQPAPAGKPSALPEAEITRLTDEIVTALKTVYDPEIPADITKRCSKLSRGLQSALWYNWNGSCSETTAVTEAGDRFQPVTYWASRLNSVRTHDRVLSRWLLQHRT